MDLGAIRLQLKRSTIHFYCLGIAALPGIDLPQTMGGFGIVRVDFDGLLVSLDGLGMVARCHAGAGKS